MEIYARTGGQLIIEEANTQYLKNPPKQKIPIKFDRIVKIQTDNFERSRNILFGIDIVREPSREISEVRMLLLSLTSRIRKKNKWSSQKRNHKTNSQCS